MNNHRFFKCKVCGKIIGILLSTGVPTICCGQEMVEMIPNTTDGAKEKHIPVTKIERGQLIVTVGGDPHPMVPEHYIQWIYVQTKYGGQRKILNPGQAPEAVFTFVDDEPVAVYEYCNLHGLWMTQL